MAVIHGNPVATTLDSTTGNPIMPDSTNSEAHVYLKSTDIVDPANTYDLDWFFGDSDNYSADLTAGSANEGRWLDMRDINTDMRSIVIEVNNAAVDYDYVVYFSRSGLDAHQYQVSANTTNTAAFVAVNLPASLGYDRYVKLQITPDGSEPDDGSLNFKAYLAGRGG